MLNDDIQHAREAAVLADRLVRLAEAVDGLQRKGEELNRILIEKIVIFGSIQHELADVRKKLDELTDRFNTERFAVERRCSEIEGKASSTATQLKIYVAIIAAVAMLVGGVLADTLKR